jgi:uncharacterized membrane protein YozB (DUF420 family)
MAFDIKNLAMINLTIQIFLVIFLSYAAFLAKKKDLQKHCKIIRIAVLLQLAAIGAIMLPSLLGYVENGAPGVLFNTEMVFHHTLGILVIGLWIYINLVYAKIIRWPGNFRSIMRSAYVLWILSFIIGLHLFIRIYL